MFFFSFDHLCFQIHFHHTISSSNRPQMKKFSLKKKEITESKIKKIGSFSLKSKSKTTNTNHTNEKSNIQIKLFQEEDEFENDGLKVKTVTISNTNEIFNDSNDEEKFPLVIKPSKNNANYFQNFLKKQSELEKNDIEERENEIARENKLVFGLNENTNSSNNDEIESNKRTELSIASGEDVTDESYKKIPVSKFGLAMLRGMGWTEELEKEKMKTNKSNIKVLENKRSCYPLAGLGAKFPEEEAGAAN